MDTVPVSTHPVNTDTSLKVIGAAKVAQIEAAARTGKPVPVGAPTLAQLEATKRTSEVDLVIQINNWHQLAVESVGNAVRYAIKCGELLLERKAKLGHGQFGKWIEANCKFSQATANNYMRAARNPNAVSNSIRHLYPSGRESKPEQRACIVKSRRPVKAVVVSKASPATQKATSSELVAKEEFQADPGKAIARTMAAATTPKDTYLPRESDVLKTLGNLAALVRLSGPFLSHERIALAVKPDKASALINTISELETWLDELKGALYKLAEAQS
jgi:hypothetical protein